MVEHFRGTSDISTRPLLSISIGNCPSSGPEPQQPPSAPDGRSGSGEPTEGHSLERVIRRSAQVPIFGGTKQLYNPREYRGCCSGSRVRGTNSAAPIVESTDALASPSGHLPLRLSPRIRSVAHDVAEDGAAAPRRPRRSRQPSCGRGQCWWSWCWRRRRTSHRC